MVVPRQEDWKVTTQDFLHDAPSRQITHFTRKSASNPMMISHGGV
jgi:hypothetical protein